MDSDGDSSDATNEAVVERPPKSSGSALEDVPSSEDEIDDMMGAARKQIQLATPPGAVKANRRTEGISYLTTYLYLLHDCMTA